MYTFRNDKVRLRAITMTDAADHWRWRNDPAVTHTLLSSRPRTQAEVDNMVSRWMDDGHGFAIEAIDLPQPTHVGSCSLFDFHWSSRHAELGMAIGEKQYWGKGYATTAMELLLEYGFGELNLHRIQLYVFSTNPAAVRVYQKCGFQIEVTLREDVYREGEFRNTYLMGLLKREWEERHV